MFRTFAFLVEAHGRSMGHSMVGRVSIPLSPPLYWTLRTVPGEAVVIHWGANKSITPGHPSTIHHHVEPAP